MRESTTFYRFRNENAPYYDDYKKLRMRLVFKKMTELFDARQKRASNMLMPDQHSGARTGGDHQ